MDSRRFIEGMATTTNIQPIETQLNYSDFIESTLAQGGSAVVESDPGVGKTIAYLVNAMMYALKHNKPVIVATSTASNRTAISDDIAKIQTHARAIGSPLAYLPAIDYSSARDYCSLPKIKALVERFRGVSAPNIIISQMEEIAQRVEASNGPVLSEDVLPEPIIHNGIVVATREDISFGPTDADAALLGTMRAELTSCLNKASLILVTQAMLAKHRLLRSAVRDQLVGCVILDEVDRMLGLDFLTNEHCSMHEVRRSIELLDTAYNIDVAAALEAVDALTEAINDIRPSDADQIMLARHRMDQSRCDAVIEKLRVLADHFNRLLESVNTNDSIAKTLHDEVSERKHTYRLDEMLGSMMSFIDNFTPPPHSETFRLKTDTDVRLFIQWEGDQPSLHVVAAAPGRSMMWLTTSGVPTIMTTGMVGSPLLQFGAQIGSKRLTGAEFRVDHFGDLKFVYFHNMPPPIVDNRVSTVYLDAVAKEIKKYFKPGEFMLVLCASYFDVQYLEAKLAGLPLIVHMRGMKMHEMISRMAGMETGAIMLTVAWEGYNIVANDGTRRGLLNSVVISRLPFAAPRPMRLETLQTIYGEKKASAINWADMRNEVVRKVYQGICRLVRGPNDKGEVLIMDPRFPPSAVIRQMLPQVAARPGHKEMIKAIPARFAHRRHYDLKVHV